MNFVRNEKGITLLEILLAMTILSIIFITLMSIFPQMGRMNKHNEDKAQAVNTAKQILNDWKTNHDVIESIEFPELGTSWPIEPEPAPSTQNYHRFVSDVPNAEIKIWKQPEKGFDETTDSIKAYKIQVLVKNNRDVVISETFGYVIVR